MKKLFFVPNYTWIGLCWAVVLYCLLTGEGRLFMYMALAAMFMERLIIQGILRTRQRIAQQLVREFEQHFKQQAPDDLPIPNLPPTSNEE